MKRKIIQLEVDTTLTNVEVKRNLLTLFEIYDENKIFKIIQIKVNAVSDWKRK